VLDQQLAAALAVMRSASTRRRLALAPMWLACGRSESGTKRAPRSDDRLADRAHRARSASICTRSRRCSF
jgi:hypothetical protein